MATPSALEGGTEPSHGTARAPFLPRLQAPPGSGGEAAGEDPGREGGKGAARDAERCEPEQRRLPWLPGGPAAAHREGAGITPTDPTPPQPIHRRGHGPQRGTAACWRPHSTPVPCDYCNKRCGRKQHAHTTLSVRGSGVEAVPPLPASGGACTPGMWPRLHHLNLCRWRPSPRWTPPPSGSRLCVRDRVRSGKPFCPVGRGAGVSCMDPKSHADPSGHTGHAAGARQ